MDKARRDQLSQNIAKQIELGFSKEEIIENLTVNGATDSEIAELKNDISASVTHQGTQEGGKYGVLSIIISIFFIGRGLYSMATGHSGIGIMFLVIGLVGLVAKIALRL